MDISGDFISMEEATRISGYKRRNISYLCKNGHLPGACKLGNRWLIPRKALEEYKPGPQGFAVVWERRRKADNPENENLESLISSDSTEIEENVEGHNDNNVPESEDNSEKD